MKRSFGCSDGMDIFRYKVTEIGLMPPRSSKNGRWFNQSHSLIYMTRSYGAPNAAFRVQSLAYRVRPYQVRYGWLCAQRRFNGFQDKASRPGLFVNTWLWNIAMKYAQLVLGPAGVGKVDCAIMLCVDVLFVTRSLRAGR